MRHDSTGLRVSLYFALVWLAGGSIALLRHFHSLTPLHIVLAAVVAVVTAMGYWVVTFTEKIGLKLVAEPLTAAGTLVSAVGYFFFEYPVWTLIVGAVVLAVFGGFLYEERKEIETARRYTKAKAKAVAGGYEINSYGDRITPKQ